MEGEGRVEAEGEVGAGSGEGEAGEREGEGRGVEAGEGMAAAAEGVTAVGGWEGAGWVGEVVVDWAAGAGECRVEGGRAEVGEEGRGEAEEGCLAGEGRAAEVEGAREEVAVAEGWGAVG